MRIYYDGAKAKEIEARLISYWETNKSDRNDAKIHVYDIIHCEMKCFNRFNGLTPKWTKQGVGMLVFGIIGQQIIQQTYPQEQVEHLSKIDEAIEGHIDIFEDNEKPLEIKSTRKRLFKRDAIPQDWIMQLECYLTMERKLKGWLLFINVFTCQVTTFCVEMTQEEQVHLNTFMLYKSYKLSQAIKERKSEDLEVTGEEYQSCPYKKECVRTRECREKWTELQRKKMWTSS